MKAMANFILQVTCAWVLMCVPGLIVVSSHLFFGEIFDTGPIEKNKDSKDANIADTTCYEDSKEYFPIVFQSRFWIEGIGVFLVALFGIFGNVATILALRRKKRSCVPCCITFSRNGSDISDNPSIHRNSSFKSSINMNSSSIINMNDCFYKLLVGLAVIDVILISYIMVEISIIGVFMDEQPQWFKIAYPYLIHPFRHIAQTASIFMVVAVSIERYRAICDPLTHRQAYYKYIIAVALISFGEGIPRFFEFHLVETVNQTWDYDTTRLNENPMYVQFNAYWNELLVTGLLPLILLVIMNFRIYLKIRASSKFGQTFAKYSSKENSSRSFKYNIDSERSSNVLMNSIVNKNNRTALSIASGERDGSIDLEMAEILEVSQAKSRNQSGERSVILNENGPGKRYMGSNLPKEFLSLTELNAIAEKSANSMYDTEKIEEDLQILAKNRKLALSYGEAVTRRRKRKEKSTIILVAIVMVFILCHMYRLFVEVYRLIYPSNILKENFYICNARGKLTMPVLLYIFHNLHFLFLTINSSVNFIIYCGVDKEFRRQVSLLSCFSMFKCRSQHIQPNQNNL